MWGVVCHYVADCCAAVARFDDIGIAANGRRRKPDGSVAHATLGGEHAAVRARPVVGCRRLDAADAAARAVAVIAAGPGCRLDPDTTTDMIPYTAGVSSED